MAHILFAQVLQSGYKIRYKENFPHMLLNVEDVETF